jgi:hypothetical protein
MKASPLVELQDGAVRQDYTARELDGHERETWWARAVDTFPGGVRITGDRPARTISSTRGGGPGMSVGR